MNDAFEAALLWAAVDELTKPRHVKLLRDDGTADWTTVPSLWWQLDEATASSSALDGGGRGSKYRTPIDLDAFEVACTVRDVIVDALAGHDQKPRTTGATPQRRAAATAQRAAERTYAIPHTDLTPVPPLLVVLVPDSLRALVSVVTALADDDLTAWWTYRVKAWCRQIQNALHLVEQPQPRRIRDTSCPTCQATHVTLDGHDGTERVPALLIDFTDGLIRAASCSACGSTWFRGDALLALADELADLATRREHPETGLDQVV